MEKDTLTARAAMTLTPVTWKTRVSKAGHTGHRWGRIVVTRNLPMAYQKMPDRRAGPPSLIGELRLVNHPGRVVGKICPKIRETRQAESESKKKKYPVQPALPRFSATYL